MTYFRNLKSQVQLPWSQQPKLKTKPCLFNARTKILGKHSLRGYLPVQLLDQKIHIESVTNQRPKHLIYYRFGSNVPIQQRSDYVNKPGSSPNMTRIRE